MFGFDLIVIIKTVGYFGLFFIIFAESGLFIGFFLPGDSLLFTAGFLASQGFLNIFLLLVLAFSGAVLGDNVGYAFGKKIGPAIFKREDSVLFHKDHLEQAHNFYAQKGPSAIVLARFLPVIRTFAPILAGVGKMQYSIFFFYNILGGALWAIGLTWLGYFLGGAIPNIDRYLIPIILAIVAVSTLPTLLQIWKIKKKN